MKNLNIIIWILTAFLLIACNSEQTTEVQHYNLQLIQSDSNWVEITDTVNVDIRCIDRKNTQGAVINSESEYIVLFDKSDKIETKFPPGHQWGDCMQYIPTNFDFSNRSLAGFCITTGIAEAKRYIFVNDRLKKYLFLLLINKLYMDKRGDVYYHWVSIPKTKQYYTFEFDTTFQTTNR